jgi:DNA modification methylase
LVKSLDYHYLHTLVPLSANTKPSHPPRHRGINGVKSKQITPYIPNKNGKKMSDYWDDEVVKTSVVNQHQNNGIEHPAMFPKEIVYLPILQTCVYPFQDKKDYSPVVLDIFAGSLTTFKVVEDINKNFNTNIKFMGYDIKRYF